MKAIRVHAPGGIEALRFEDVPEPAPKAGEALVRIEAAGVNFIDVYHRTGLYKSSLPATLGQEGAGVVEAVGPGVTDPRPGERVAWAGSGVFGGYAEKAVVPADRLVHVPEGVSARQATAAMLQGMTAHYLACSTYPLEPGDVALVHAAAGGVGLLLTQIAKNRGARVIGTVSTEDKAKAAIGAGASDAIIYTKDDFAVEAKKLTNGAGVNVIYDSVGKTTFMNDFECIKPRGMVVVYGQASGAIEPVDTG